MEACPRPGRPTTLSPVCHTYNLPLGRSLGLIKGFLKNDDKRQCLRRVCSDLMARKPQQPHAGFSPETI
jgi:hypothetical protein